MAGRQSEITVLFADCRDFTTLTHERGPEVITPLVDEFFRKSAATVVKHDGIVDDFRGDAILAFFNIPLKRENHVARAIAAATEIQMAVPEINAMLGGENLLRVGVGITTGMALTATVGSDDCKDYTMMGDVVNIGSRLQNLAGPGEIVVSAEAYAQIRSAFPNARERRLDVKGIREPVRAYSLT